MFLKRNIEIEINNDNSSVYIHSYYKNQEVGRISCGINKEKNKLRLMISPAKSVIKDMDP